jgi:hypothetical protein
VPPQLGGGHPLHAPQRLRQPQQAVAQGVVTSCQAPTTHMGMPYALDLQGVAGQAQVTHAVHSASWTPEEGTDRLMAL